MARTRKSIQPTNLYKYDVLIEDIGPRSDYFKVTQFDGYFYGGRNAFLIAGASVLKPNSKILVEILNVNGETVYSAPKSNFIEGNSRLVQIEVYNDTPPGPGKIIILGCAQTYLDGTPIPTDWQNKFNIRWVTDVTISPFVRNKTPIRFINTPTILTEEKFYPTPATASFSQSIDVPSGSYQLIPVRYNIFQNGYLIKLQNPTTENIFRSEYLGGVLKTIINISGSTEVISGSLPLTKILNSTTAESRGTLLTSSLGTIIVSAFISGSGSNYITTIEPYGNITASSVINTQYNKIVESNETGSQISFAKLRISNLNTLSGEINKIRVSYTTPTDPSEYIVLGDVPTQVEELLATDSGSKIVSLGNFNQIKIDDYWYAATMSVSKSDANPILPNYYFSSSVTTNLPITQSSTVLLNSINVTPEIENNIFKNNKSYFIGTKNLSTFQLFPNSEYTLKFDATVSNISGSTQLNQTDYILEVYLVKPENSTGNLIETNPRGQLIGELIFTGKGGNQLFENKELNFRPKIITPVELGLRFIVYGGFWNISNISLKPAEEEFFSPDEVAILLPNVNFNDKLVNFKTEYLDINNNSITVSTISNPTYFTGSGASSISGPSASFAATASYINHQNPGDNRVITSLGSGSLNAEQNLLFNGSTLTVTGSLIVSGASTLINIGPARFTGSVNISGSTNIIGPVTASSLTVLDTITAKEFYTQYVTSSIIFQSGSTKFGDTPDDVMNVTGSIIVSGSMIISSSGNVGIGTTFPISRLQIQGNVSASSYTSSISNAVGFLGTASFANTSSFSVSSSFAQTSSFAISSSRTVTSSFAVTSSTATSITFVPTTASFSLTSSFVLPTGLPTGTVSASSQISHTATTGYVANEHINHTSVSITAGSGLSGGGTIAATRTLTLDTSSVHFLDGVKKELNTEGVISSSGQVSYTGLSNIPVGIVSSSTQVASLLPVGTVSSSGQVSYTGLSNIPVGILSSSTQINALSGVSASFATSASRATTSSFAISASWSPQVISTYTNATDNRVLTSTGAGGINAESNLNFDGTILGITGSADINNAGYPGFRLFAGASQRGEFVWAEPFNRLYFQTFTDDATFFYSRNGSTDFIVTGSTGNVGIGTINPSTKLQIQGNVSASSYTSSLSNQIGFVGTASFAVSASRAISASWSPQVISTYTNASDDRVLTSTGAGGINGEANLTFDGTVLSISTNNTKYLQGGDDAALWDINVANTLGVYGVQDSTVGAIKLGSSGQTLYSNATGLGIGTISPSATLHIQGNASASSYTSSISNAVGFLGTASFAISSSRTVTSSFSTTASYANNGTKTFRIFTPLDNQPPATNFATLDTRNSIATLDFDAAGNESAIFVSVIPDNFVITNGVRSTIYWTATSAVSGDVVWGTQFERTSGGQDIDSNGFDVQTLVTASTSATSGVVNLTSVTSSAVDSLVSGDLFRIKVFRSGAATADTMTGDAELLGIELEII